MRWSFRLARIAGIDINIHLTFLLLLPFGAMLWGGRYGNEGALFGVLMILLLFACVTLHELGHALAAKAVGIPVKEIQLLPIGGVAVMGRPITKPLHELFVALAGPLMNVLIVMALLVLAAASGMFAQFTPQQLVEVIGAPSFVGAVLWLIQANILLVLFNMIPAFPMDGGRVLRAGLAMVTGMPRATTIAAAIGQGLALLMGLWGFFSANLLLVAGAVFIFMGARQEAMAAQVMGVLSGLKVFDAFTRNGPTLEIGQRLSEAGDLMLATGRRALPVMQGERLLGVVTLDQVHAAKATGRGEAWVTAVMRRELPRIAHDAPLDEAQQLIAEHQIPVLAVYEHDAFVGLLSVDDMRAAFTRGTPREPRPQQPTQNAPAAD